MRKISTVARLAVAATLMTTSLVAITTSPAMAAGCNAGYTNATTYRAGACTGYPSYFKVRASAKCFGTPVYGSWVFVASYSYARCSPGQVMSGGTYSVSP